MISIIPLYNDSFQGGFDLCKLGQFHASTALLGDGCPRRRDGPTSCQGCLKLNALHYGRGWNRARFPATIPAFGLKLLPNMWTHWSDIFCHVLSPMKLEVIKNIIPVCWRAWYMVYPLAQTNIGDGDELVARQASIDSYILFAIGHHLLGMTQYWKIQYTMDYGGCTFMVHTWWYSYIMIS